MLELTIYLLLIVTVLVAAYVLNRLIYAFKNFKIKNSISGPVMLKDLPSVSVCVPARNETHAMTDCLERLVSSKYPKLEIIVLDDSSVDDTSILIKSFAHAGVRFVEGSDLRDGWLGKNNALQGLLKEASGTYILFMDVDTRIEPDTIGQLVAYATDKRISMLSILPRRNDSWRLGVLLTPLRYFWELIFHTKNSPAVASNAWMIDRRIFIDEYGGFEPLADFIQPEKALAKEFMRKDQYRFLISNKQLGVGFEKKWSSQIETGVRLDYSMLGGRLLNAVLAVMGLMLLNAPILLIIGSLISGWGIVGDISFAVIVLYIIIYSFYLYKLWDRRWLVGALLWPVVLFQELAILVISIYRNISGTVTWKGRPVTANLRNK